MRLQLQPTPRPQAPPRPTSGSGLRVAQPQGRAIRLARPLGTGSASPDTEAVGSASPDLYGRASPRPTPRSCDSPRPTSECGLRPVRPLRASSASHDPWFWAPPCPTPRPRAPPCLTPRARILTEAHDNHYGPEGVTQGQTSGVVQGAFTPQRNPSSRHVIPGNSHRPQRWTHGHCAVYSLYGADQHTGSPRRLPGWSET